MTKNNQEQELSSLAEIMLRKELVQKDIDADDEKIKTLNLNTRYGLYMAEQFDMHRREKHDIAITSLQKLNDISVQRLGRIVYEGIIDSDHRSEIAQSIMLFGNEVLELI